MKTVLKLFLFIVPGDLIVESAERVGSIFIVKIPVNT